METDRYLSFPFASGRSGSGPATWGQQAIWDVVRHLGSDAARYNVSGGIAVAPPLPVARVTAVVGELVLAHDSLRTRLTEGADGRAAQTAYADGALPVVLRPGTAEEAPKLGYALHTALRERPFDVERDWPIRIGLVESGGLVHHIVFCLPHTATDGWGLRNLLADFTALAAGGPDAAAVRDRRHRLQPLEEAEFQSSARGRRQDEAARRSWYEKLAAGPSSQFPGRAGLPPAASFPNAVLDSPALSLAMDEVADRLGVSPSLVLLAAAAAARGSLTGVRDAVFQVVVNNRFRPGLGGGVNTVAQEGLFHLTGTDEDFPALLRRAFGATLCAQRHAYYDKGALDRDIGLARSGGGRVGDHSCVVNDYRGLLPSLGYAKPAPVPLDEARRRTQLSWPIEFEPRRDLGFALDALDGPGSTRLAMTADSTLFPRPEMARFLYGIEDLVVDAALALGAD